MERTRTDWGSLHSLRLPNVMKCLTNGWVDNNNNAPWSAAGPFQPQPCELSEVHGHVRREFCGLHALKLLTGSRGWTLEKLQAAAFDSYQPGFAVLIPSLLDAYHQLPHATPATIGWLTHRRATLMELPLERRVFAQTLAMFWGEALQKGSMFRRTSRATNA